MALVNLDGIPSVPSEQLVMLVAKPQQKLLMGTGIGRCSYITGINAGGPQSRRMDSWYHSLDHSWWDLLRDTETNSCPIHCGLSLREIHADTWSICILWITEAMIVSGKTGLLLLSSSALFLLLIGAINVCMAVYQHHLPFWICNTWPN